jgi:hypothetical protein
MTENWINLHLGKTENFQNFWENIQLFKEEIFLFNVFWGGPFCFLDSDPEAESVNSPVPDSHPRNWLTFFNPNVANGTVPLREVLYSRKVQMPIQKRSVAVPAGWDVYATLMIRKRHFRRRREMNS